MYSLDVNFLKDRAVQKSDKFSRYTKTSIGGQTPIYLGLAVGAILPAIVGVGWLVLQNQNAQLETKIQSIDGELNRLGVAEEEIKKIQAQTSQVQSETKALASVFNQIRPWSAMLQDCAIAFPKQCKLTRLRNLQHLHQHQRQPLLIQIILDRKSVV